MINYLSLRQGCSPMLNISLPSSTQGWALLVTVLLLLIGPGIIPRFRGWLKTQLRNPFKKPQKELPINVPLINVPKLPLTFLARPDDLKAVKDLLLADSGPATAITGTPSRVGLHGMGGIGKSILAAAMARDEEVQSRFKDGIFWLTLGTDPKITSRQADLAGMLGVRQVFTDVEQGKAYLSKQLAEKACLIVLDDVWDAEDVKTMFTDLGPKCRLLITTRDSGIITALEAREFRLDLLSTEKALELLASWAGKDLAALPKEASLIVEECGRLPLAIALCGAQVKDKVPWKDLLDALKKAELQFLDHPQGSVMRSMKVSVDNLEDLHSECYLELAVFPPDEAIPEAAISTLWTHAHKLEDRDARQIIRILERKALLKSDDERSAIELHDLQHDYLRAVCKDLKSLHGLLLDAYIQKTSNGRWPSGPNDDYFFQHLAYHLSKAGKEDDLRSLLLAFGWIQARLNATDVVGLIHDYDFLKADGEISAIQDSTQLFRGRSGYQHTSYTKIPASFKASSSGG